CPEGWEEYAMNCYRFFTDKKDWNSAKSFCDSMDAHLVAIESEEENNWIFDRINYKDEGDDWWTDGSDEGSEDKWYWHHSNSRMIYADWNLSPREPNGKQSENCLLLQLRLNSWVDAPCSYELKFICEK
ncbi:perlucin-like protein, partial [Saccostrea cucullata]|uniref:perlucin-like protein n=1 Tax=Saccostrea cuccullata TaxID=36930 RepID=UPI002ECFB8F8